MVSDSIKINKRLIQGSRFPKLLRQDVLNDLIMVLQYYHLDGRIRLVQDFSRLDDADEFVRLNLC